MAADLEEEDGAPKMEAICVIRRRRLLILSLAGMTGKKWMITSEELVSLRLRYLILNFCESLAPLEGETLRSHREGCVCLNEWMFKAGVHIPLEFGISKLLNVILGGISFAGKRTTKIVSNLPNLVSDYKLRFFNARFRAMEEPARAWGYSTRGVFLRWCEGLSLSEGSRVLLCSEPVGPVGPSSSTRFSFEGSRAPASRRTGDRVWLVECSKKRKQLIDVDAVGEGYQPVVANKEVGEDVEGQNEEDLRLGLALSREEARCSSLFVASPEAHDDAPGPSGRSSEGFLESYPKAIIPSGIDAFLNPNPAFDSRVPEVSEWGDAGANAS
ncbi:hypothetical protein ACLOJK_007010 [Asimina triloba]